MLHFWLGAYGGRRCAASTLLSTLKLQHRKQRNIPVMIGTTLHEFTMSTYVPRFRTITKEKAVEFTTKYGERTDGVPYRFRKPTRPINLKIWWMWTSCSVRCCMEQAKLKAAQQVLGLYVHVRVRNRPYLTACFAARTAWTFPCSQQCSAPRFHDRGWRCWKR